MKNYIWVGLVVFSLSLLVSAQYFQPVVLQGDGSSSYNITVCSTDAECGDVVWQEFVGSGTTVQTFYIDKPYAACFNVPFWYTAYNGSNEVIQDVVKSRLFGNMWCGNISLGEGGESYTNIGSYLRIPWFDSCAYLNTDADGVFMCQPTLPVYDDTALRNNLTEVSNALSGNISYQLGNNSGQQTQIDEFYLVMSGNYTLILQLSDNLTAFRLAFLDNLTAQDQNNTAQEEQIRELNLNLVGNSSLVDLMYGWGDWHSFADDVTTNISRLAAENLLQLNMSTEFGGDVSGVYDAIVVADDSHTHNDSTVADDLTIETTKTLTVGGGFASGGSSLTSDGGAWLQYLVVIGNVTVGTIVKGNISGDFLPSLDNSWRLGNNSRRWKEIWGVTINGTTLYEGGVPLSTTYASNTNLNNLVTNVTNINGSVAKWDAAFSWGNWATAVNNVRTNLTNINASVYKWDIAANNISSLQVSLNNAVTNLTNINASVWKYDTAVKNISTLGITSSSGLIFTSNILGIDSSIIANWSGIAAKFVKRSDWTTIDDYPAACGAGQYVTQVGDTLTCSTPAGTAPAQPNINGANVTAGKVPNQAMNASYVVNVTWCATGNYLTFGATAACTATQALQPSIDWANITTGTAPSYVDTQLYGDGSDGAVVVSTGTSLTRDMYYDNLSITNNAVLNPSGFKIFVRMNLSIDSGASIASNGGNGGNGTNGSSITIAGGSGGSAGAAANSGGSLPASLSGVAGVTGGGGGGSSPGANGSNGGAGNGGNTQTNSLRGASAGVVGGAGGAGGKATLIHGGGSAGLAGAAGTRTALAAGSGDMRDIVRAIQWATISGAGSVVVPGGDSGAGSGGGGGGGGGDTGASLSGDSMISTPRGYIKIRNLRVGDTVYSWDDTNIVIDEVSKLLSHTLDKPVKHFIFNGKLDATHNHIVYTNRGWLPAENITVGDILLGEYGQEVRVDSISSYLSQNLVYDLEVKNNHNFFAGGYLVHNIGTGGGGGGGSGGSGGNGGYILIAARTIINSGSITANGGIGGNGGSGGNSSSISSDYGGGGGGGAPGSGGSGGVVVIITNSNSIGTVTLNGGSPGNPGVGGKHVGTNAVDGATASAGNTGAVGLVIQIHG